MVKEITAVFEDYWPHQVESWKASGLSQSAYCRQAGISHKKFHYHMHRLKDGDKPKLRFIEAQVAAKTVVTQQERKVILRLILPNGVGVTLEDVSFDLVPQILEMARGLPC